MSKLKEKELLQILEGWFWGCDESYLESESDKGERAYKEIVALIKKPEVTEEWIKEKAKKFLKLAYSITRTEPDILEHRINIKFIKEDFIRKLMEDVSITVDPHGKSGK